MDSLNYAYTRNLPTDSDGQHQKALLPLDSDHHWVHEANYKENKELYALMDKLEPDDHLFVTSYLALAHSPLHLLQIIEEMEQKQAKLTFVDTNQSLDDILSMTLAEHLQLFTQFHSEAISLATRAGLDEAKEKGVTSGRPRKKDANVEEAIRMYESNRYTLAQIKDKTNISKSTLYRYLDKDYGKEADK